MYYSKYTENGFTVSFKKKVAMFLGHGLQQTTFCLAKVQTFHLLLEDSE